MSRSAGESVRGEPKQIVGEAVRLARFGCADRMWPQVPPAQTARHSVADMHKHAHNHHRCCGAAVVRWTTASALALIGTAICFLNFFAAADLGYDAYPGGRAIISRWAYATLGLFVAGAVCGVVAVR